jgi:poly-gamma-glutamate synthesis protein (capsule biosynthesis protein)
MVTGRQGIVKIFWRAAALLMVLLSASACSAGSGQPVTLAFLGDVMIGRDVYASHRDGDWDTALAAIAPTLKRADLSLANLESPVCLADTCAAAMAGAAPTGINLCALPDGVNMLGASGIDMLSLENNHSADCEKFDAASSEGSSDFWEENKLELIQLETQPVVKEINGIRFAFLAFDDIGTELDFSAAQDAIAAADTGKNIIVVSVHWGAEYQASPTPRQRKIAAAFSEAGADIIWGHHPHVLQAVEWIERADNTKSLVMYSLGNALFDQVVPDDTRQSVVLTVTVDRGGAVTLQPEPFVIDPFEGIVHLADPGAAESVLQDLHLQGGNVIKK